MRLLLFKTIFNEIMKKVFTFICLVFICLSLNAQDLRFYDLPPVDSLNHSSITKLSVISYQFSDKDEGKRSFKKWLGDKFFRENFLYVKKANYFFTLDPLFDNYLGKDFISNKNIWGNTRGLRAQGIIDLGTNQSPSPVGEGLGERFKDKRLEFSTTYFESQSIFTPYLDSIVSTNRVVPGQMYYRGSGAAMDHSLATGWLRYVPNKIFSFEAGHGKNYFGNGYRSLLLSDAAPYYPYFRIDTKIWKIHYVNLWAEFQDMNYWQEYGEVYQKKYGAFHYLSFAATDRLELSLFEVINWQGRDSTHYRNFEINYLNPIIMLRPIEWTIGSADNVIMGAGFSYKFKEATYVYGQFVLDEINMSALRKGNFGSASNKMGWQAGFKTWIPMNFFKPETRNPKPETVNFIYLQSELNSVRPYTYSHITSKSNYGHLNQSLAHPLGANFMEWISFVRLHLDRFVIEGRYSWAMFGSDTEDSNYGHNIYLPYTEHEFDNEVFIGNGILNHLTYKTLTASYQFNPVSNFNIFISLTDRRQIVELNQKRDFIVQFGVRSSVRNLYYDY